MSPTKPFSKRKKPQTVVDSIVSQANIVLNKLYETSNRQSVVLWLDNFDHIELYVEDNHGFARYYKRNQPKMFAYSLNEEEFAIEILFNRNAFEKLNSLASDILAGHNTGIVELVP